MRRNIARCCMAACMMLTASAGMAQHRYYCEVKGIEKEYDAGLKIIFDFGTKTPYTILGDLDSKLQFVDEQGKVIDFNSMVDAANYMAERGWTFQQAYTSVYSKSPITHWIFYKEAESMEKAREGIMTKDEYKKLHQTAK